MGRAMQRLPHLGLSRDLPAWRTALVAFVLLGGVGTLLLAGGAMIGAKGPATLQAWMGAGARGPWAPLAAVLGFVALACLGAPQFVLIAASVVAFGPWRGFLYSWIGNLISALLGFYLGRRLGARTLRAYAGERVRDFMDMIGRNGFWASLLVRLVPAAPFIFVNMAAGVTSMRVLDFVAGTAVGSTPKIALIAFAGDAAVKAVRGGGVGHWASVAAALVVWVALGLAARTWLKRRERERAGAVNAPATP